MFLSVAAIAAVAVIGLAWYFPPPPRPYHLDESPPPFLILLGAAFWGSVVGGLTGGLWHVWITVFRWIRGRFPGEGRLYTMPLRALMGFGEGNAGQLGAGMDGEKAKTGHGLTAVFDDGSMVILTGNAWNYRSIVGKHRDLMKVFRTPRDKILAAWAERQKIIESAAAAATPTQESTPQGIPATL